MRINKNAIKNKIQHYKVRLSEFTTRLRTKKSALEDIEEQNKLIDIASKDSFPASDPPAYISKIPPEEEVHRAP